MASDNGQFVFVVFFKLILALLWCFVFGKNKKWYMALRCTS